MLPLTIFLAKLIGLYCIVVPLALMARKQSVLATLDAFVRNPALLMLSEVLALIAGLAMVLGHNVWSGGALPVVVTLVGWAIAIRSAVLLALSPETTVKFFAALGYGERFYIYLGGTLILGLYLTIAGFSA